MVSSKYRSINRMTLDEQITMLEGVLSKPHKFSLYEK